MSRASLTELELRAKLRGRVEAAGGVRGFARLHGFSAPYVSDALQGRRTIAGRMASALGYVRQEVRTVEYFPINQGAGGATDAASRVGDRARG